MMRVTTYLLRGLSFFFETLIDFKAMDSRSKIEFMECLKLTTIQRAQQLKQQQNKQLKPFDARGGRSSPLINYNNFEWKKNTSYTNDIRLSSAEYYQITICEAKMAQLQQESYPPPEPTPTSFIETLRIVRSYGLLGTKSLQECRKKIVQLTMKYRSGVKRNENFVMPGKYTQWTLIWSDGTEWWNEYKPSVSRIRFLFFSAYSKSDPFKCRYSFVLFFVFKIKKTLLYHTSYTNDIRLSSAEYYQITICEAKNVGNLEKPLAVPLFYVVMTKKTQNAYEAVLNHVVEVHHFHNANMKE
ncbi:unnamed protein product [Trichogramma brassicae]|uniref:Uncharacterized protein n=1 Tax=Trichogramma brassicae TaxID=86971 RepID=A0A6H5J158_9HYME|nr:unnamed protein product [Trichogramma brassicae]